VRPILWWNVLVATLLVGYLGSRYLRSAELDRLADRLGHFGPTETFPIAYFSERAPVGDSPQEVWPRMREYTDVRYFLLPIAGTVDTLVVQQFQYPLAWDQLKVEIGYRRGAVFDVEVSGQRRKVTPISPEEAYRRLKWRPPS
jgi:hypothetical protein